MAPAPFRRMAAVTLATLAIFGSPSAASDLRTAMPAEVPYVPAGGTGGMMLIGWGALPDGDDLPDYQLGQVVSTSGWKDALVAQPGNPDGSPNFIDLSPDPLTFGTVGIACGEFHTLLLHRDGSVSGRGWNRAGQITIPSGLGTVIAIACGADHSLALRTDGTVAGWGWNAYGQATPPPDLKDVVQIAGGATHSLALDRNRRVTAWGRNQFGQCTVPDDLRDVVAVSAGATHSIALRADGTPVVWGGFEDDLYEIPAAARGLVAVAAGAYFNLGLRSDGRVVFWGEEEDGYLVPPSDLRDVVAIAAGNYHAMALIRDGSVRVWGVPEYGTGTIPNGLRGITAIAAGGFHCQVLVQTAPHLSPPRRGPEGIACQLNLPVGRRYVVEASRDLESWQVVDEDVALPGRYLIQWSTSRGHEGFYRVRPVW